MEDASKAIEAAVQRVVETRAPVTQFDLHFPLPYRICVAIILGIWAWGLNVKYLTSAHIDVGYLVKYSFSSTDATTRAPRPLHHGIFHMATVLTAIVGVSWSLFGVILLTRYHNIVTSAEFTTRTVRSIDILPETTLFIVLVSFVLPGDRFHANGRRRLRSVVRRIMFGGIERDRGRLPDILIADGMTSYTRVLLDWGVTVCMFLAGHSCVGRPDRVNCSGPLFMGLILSTPYLIRFRQCTIDYARTGARMHLANCMKYASALPVVVFASLHKSYKDAKLTADPANPATNIGDAFGEHDAFRCWVYAAIFNSAYSFIWDVTQDWNLELLTCSPFKYKHKGLRQVLALKPNLVYYLAVLFDLLIRIIWAHKLTTLWSGYGDTEYGLFVMEIIEIVRRGVWMCLRIEKEWILSSKLHEETAAELGSLKNRLHVN